MKPLLLATLVAFFIGGAIGAILPNLISSHTTASLNSSVGSPIETDLDLTCVSELEKENEALSQKLKSLQKELDRVNHNLASINTENVVQNPEPTEAQVRELKKKWIETILSQDDPRFAKRVEREMSRMIQTLGLTPDQATELGLLMEKRDQQRRLMMVRSLGLISEEEYASMFAELGAFDFDLSFSSILSPEQQQGLESVQSEQREQGLEQVSRMMADRLKLNDAERFSSDERVLINDALKVAMDRQVDLQIPPAIRELDINRMDKRILAAAYDQLDSATFEKLYESVVEENESGNTIMMGDGGGRRRPPPPGGF